MEVFVPDFTTAPGIFDAMHQAIQAGWVAACHDLCEGGLAVAAAEMVLGGELGARIDIARLPGADEIPTPARLFSETPTRFLVEVAPEKLESFLGVFRTLSVATVGEVTAPVDGQAILELRNADTVLCSVGHEDLLRWNRAL